MIPGIPSLRGVELLILLAIVLLFFGAKRLPQLAKTIGGGVRELCEGLAGADNEDEVQVRKRKRRNGPKTEQLVVRRPTSRRRTRVLSRARALERRGCSV